MNLGLENLKVKAIFTKENDGITVTFPDFKGCITCGYNMEEAIKNSEEAIRLHLLGMIDDNEKIELDNNFADINLNNNQKLIVLTL